ncbi:hypothetical protein CALCODRAFT_505481 [Calocera cornea HHB12733]|uniref:Uncharacterized protein n=1 Tax=Calocera cornea HHB12733 TaxID=1353952 RepID=A0A165K618_9BASI|nr:hypothetical protein CALCODRAFT_505481 [Calocera cornea HHB12733]
MADTHLATPRLSWDSAARRDEESPPRKFQRADCNDDIDDTGGSSPLGAESTVGTQSSTKAGTTSDTAVEDEAVGVEVEWSECSTADPDDCNSVIVVPTHTAHLLNQPHTSESLAMVVMVGASYRAVLTSNATARFYGLDAGKRKWTEMGSFTVHPSASVWDTLPATVSRHQNAATVTIPFYVHNRSSAERPSLTVVHVVQQGASVSFSCICNSAEVVLVSDGRWTVSQKIGYDHLIVRGVSDDQCLYLEGGGEFRVGRLAAVIIDRTVWVVNYDYACVEGYTISEEHSPVQPESADPPHIRPICCVEMDDAIVNARFEVTVHRKFLAIRYESWITLYKMEEVSDGLQNPLIPVWTLDLLSAIDDESRFIADFTFALDAGHMYFLDQSRFPSRGSSLKAIRLNLSPSTSATPVYALRDEASVVVQGGSEDLLQHVNHLRYEEGTHALVLGRKNSCLWMTMPLGSVPAQALPITVNLGLQPLRFATVRALKDNANWQREVEYQLQTWQVRTSASLVEHVSMSDTFKSFRPGLITGKALTKYWTDWVGQPWGDSWVLEHGLAMKAPMELVAVYVTSYMNCAVVRATFTNGPRYFRLDRYHEVDRIQQSIVLTCWNEKSWEACLDDSTSENPDRSSWLLDFDALFSEEAVEMDRQGIARALKDAPDELAPSPELLAAWLRLGLVSPGESSRGEGEEERDNDLMQAT